MTNLIEFRLSILSSIWNFELHNELSSSSTHVMVGSDGIVRVQFFPLLRVHLVQIGLVFDVLEPASDKLSVQFT